MLLGLQLDIVVELDSNFDGLVDKDVAQFHMYLAAHSNVSFLFLFLRLARMGLDCFPRRSSIPELVDCLYNEQL